MVKIRQIRESVEIRALEMGTGPVSIVQRRINLQQNKQHNLVHCDFFMDNQLVSADDELFNGFVEVFVSPYPIIYTDNTFLGFPNRGPSASQDGILFKTILSGRDGPNLIEDEWPNKFASYNNEFDFYHPELYITLLFHSMEAVILKDVAMSFLFTLSSKNVKDLNYSLGILKEDMNMMTMNYTSMGRAVAWNRNVGQIAPAWKWGGARPEFMANAGTLTEFWLAKDTADGEPTASAGELRGIVKRARQMVENPKAFGTGGTTEGDLPDWLSFITQEGFEAGAVREQWPPIKHADNGNVLTL